MVAHGRGSPRVEADQDQTVPEWHGANSRAQAAVDKALPTTRPPPPKVRERHGAVRSQPPKRAVTTGEWAEQMRSVTGNTRPTGVRIRPVEQDRRAGTSAASRDAVAPSGRRLSFLVASGLDGTFQRCRTDRRARTDCGMEIRLRGYRPFTPSIVSAALEGEHHVVGLSILGIAYSIGRGIDETNARRRIGRIFP